MGSENKICFLFHSTHPRRVWRIVFRHISFFLEFQSTHPRRVWHQNRLLQEQFKAVSIHTPTKGVTNFTLNILLHANSFNPHTHEGCDRPQQPSIRAFWRFQSTHPRRVWLFNFLFVQNLTKVSIHTPTKGVTTTTKVTDGNMQVSIHTPTKGVTVLPTSGADWTEVSIHTPTKGVTKCRPSLLYPIFVSIHTPTKGVTSCRTPQLNQDGVSIHTPTKGVTLICYLEFTFHVFQSTHPRRVWPLIVIFLPLKSVFQSTHPRRVWHKYLNEV